MNKIKKILAPTDYSDLSCVGLRYAFETARELGAELIVLHVVSMSDDWFAKRGELRPVRNLVAEQKEFLDKFLRTKFAESMNLVEVRQRVELGTAYSNIAEMAEREAVDLIVLSTHGRTGFDHILLGSVTEKVIAHAHCPVLAIPATRPHVPIAEAA
ncbi:MAG: universal stress protein [Deltaproteobacteria bacterium]|nr:universal stress protein [Deltaproteobacteria bacterium]